MTYNNDLTWILISDNLSARAAQVINTLNVSLEQYNDWQSFRAGRTDAVIATALGRTAAEIADMDSAFAAFKLMYDFMNNVAGPIAGDRFFSLRKFG